LSDRAAVRPLAIALRGSIDRADAPGTWVRAAAAMAASAALAARNGILGPGLVICDVGGLDRPGLPTIDVLARLALAARRCRRELRLEHASPALQELLELCGLSGVLRTDDERAPPARAC
jgi:hypothetical protein